MSISLTVNVVEDRRQPEEVGENEKSFKSNPIKGVRLQPC